MWQEVKALISAMGNYNGNAASFAIGKFPYQLPNNDKQYRQYYELSMQTLVIRDIIDHFTNVNTVQDCVPALTNSVWPNNNPGLWITDRFSASILALHNPTTFSPSCLADKFHDLHPWVSIDKDGGHDMFGGRWWVRARDIDALLLVADIARILGDSDTYNKAITYAKDLWEKFITDNWNAGKGWFDYAPQWRGVEFNTQSLAFASKLSFYTSFGDWDKISEHLINAIYGNYLNSPVWATTSNNEHIFIPRHKDDNPQHRCGALFQEVAIVHQLWPKLSSNAKESVQSFFEQLISSGDYTSVYKASCYLGNHQFCYTGGCSSFEPGANVNIFVSLLLAAIIPRDGSVLVPLGSSYQTYEGGIFTMRVIDNFIFVPLRRGKVTIYTGTQPYDFVADETALYVIHVDDNGDVQNVVKYQPIKAIEVWPQRIPTILDVSLSVI